MRLIFAALSISVIALGITAVHLRRLLEEERLRVAEVYSRPMSANSVRVASVRSRGENMPADHQTPHESGATDPIFGEVSETSQNRREQPVLERPGPEMVQKGLVHHRAFLPINYPDIGDALGLTPGQVNDLFDLFTQQVSRITSGNFGNGNVGDDPFQAYMRMYQANEAEIASLLGNKYPLWRQYQTETPVREQMNDLKIVLSAENLPPLNQTVADAMRTELNRARKEISQQHPPAMATMRQVDLYTIENIRTLTEIASRYLTPEQLSAYKQLLERTAGRERLRLTDTAGAN